MNNDYCRWRHASRPRLLLLSPRRKSRREISEPNWKSNAHNSTYGGPFKNPSAQEPSWRWAIFAIVSGARVSCALCGSRLLQTRAINKYMWGTYRSCSAYAYVRSAAGRFEIFLRRSRPLYSFTTAAEPTRWLRSGPFYRGKQVIDVGLGRRGDICGGIVELFGARRRAKVAFKFKVNGGKMLSICLHSRLWRLRER